MKLSTHAKVRMQQRGISRLVVDWLAAYGEINHLPGAEMFYFNQKARNALERDLGQRAVRCHEKALDAYMVCTEGWITTVGHRYQRMVRH